MAKHSEKKEIALSRDFIALSKFLTAFLGNDKEPEYTFPETHLISLHKLQLIIVNKNPKHVSDKIPPDIYKAFRQQIALIELKNHLENANTPFLLLKGLALNQILHGNKLYRPSLDIDLLIAPEKVFDVHHLLINEGWKRISPEFEIKENQKSILLKNFDQFLYHHPEKKVNLEIHWRLFRNNFILPLSFHDLWQEKQSVKIGNAEFYTMGNAHYLAYLLLHGFQHLWERLMWLADIDILIKKSTPEERKKFIQLSESYEFEKQVSITFSLLERLLKTENYPSEIKNRITSKHREKAQSLIYYIPGSIDPAPNTKSISYKLKRLALEAEHSGSFRARLFYLYNYPFFMYKYVSLPSALAFLYPLFWPYVFVRNKLRSKN